MTNNPFLKQLSPSADRRIRLRLLVSAASLWLRSHALAIAAPAAAVAMIVLVIASLPDRGEDPLRASVFAAQAAEYEKTTTGIYHLTRTIEEGFDKPAYVALAEGSIVSAPQRVDTVETWQHNETSLALISSTAHTHPFRAYLTIEHDGELGVHFYGERAAALPPTREAFDAAHDLGSLYTAYVSTERPGIPTIPDTAVLISRDPIIFAYTPGPGLSIEARIDPTTNLIDQETIYVERDGGRFEMTVITYRDRTYLAAEEFEEVFATSRYPFQPLSDTE